MTTVSSEENAYQAIIEMIIMHRYPPGANVVESQIAEQLKMSRTPVRSALKRLVSDGLLESTLNKGCSVPMLSRGGLDRQYRYRHSIEPACAREAAQFYRQEFKERIEELIAEEDLYVRENPWGLHVVNEKMHNLVVEIADNPYYLHPVKQVNWRSQLYLFFFDNFYSERVMEIKKRPKGEYKSPQQHLRLFEAIMRHATGEAEKVMHDHISLTYKFLTKRDW
ncbi:MAG: GntR family transcriptional regulator [Cloacibacillus porcorum]|nr:GntR family transcriptional regulator [Cloacibacillus porcorum]